MEICDRLAYFVAYRNQYIDVCLSNDYVFLVLLNLVLVVRRWTTNSQSKRHIVLNPMPLSQFNPNDKLATVVKVNVPVVQEKEKGDCSGKGTKCYS